jgi:hypothetical protein
MFWIVPQEPFSVGYTKHQPSMWLKECDARLDKLRRVWNVFEHLKGTHHIERVWLRNRKLFNCPQSDWTSVCYRVANCLLIRFSSLSIPTALTELFHKTPAAASDFKHSIRRSHIVSGGYVLPLLWNVVPWILAQFCVYRSRSRQFRRKALQAATRTFV